MLTEYERVKKLDIGEMTDILEAYPTYNYFDLIDPDRNVIEVTGGYHICQSCGMEMRNCDFGKNADGSINMDYCKYCYPNGKFGKDETMEEMIESCIPFYVDERFKTAEEAHTYLAKLYPNLKRWKI